MEVRPRGEIWQAIRQAGLRQREFAKLVNTSEANVSRVVTGRLNLDEVQQTRWARVLKRRREELFGNGELGECGRL